MSARLILTHLLVSKKKYADLQKAKAADTVMQSLIGTILGWPEDIPNLTVDLTSILELS